MKTAKKAKPGGAAAQRAAPAADAPAQARRKQVGRATADRQRDEPAAASAPAPRVRKRQVNGKSQSENAFNPLKQVLWTRPGFLVRRLHQIHDALFFRECQTHNITPVQFGILTALSMNPWMDQKAIGYELALDRTTTADVLKRLEEKGLIERRVNPDDRRSRLSVITKLGLETLNKLHPGMHTAQEDLLAPLSDLNRIAFTRLLSLLVEAHENVDHS